jgi:hypothetical protein
MDTNKIREILNEHVFKEETKTLLLNILENPNRFVGVFRSTGPRLKILQNLLQSRETRYGDALEEVIKYLLRDIGFVYLDPVLPAQTDQDKEMNCDHYFKSQDGNIYYLIEQKVRDDHDSTKKRGQLDNFKRKLSYLKQRHPNNLVGIMYFIDPTLQKNQGFYKPELTKIASELNVETHLFYNGAFFEYFEGHQKTWETLIKSLKIWRDTIPQNIELDFDKAAQTTFDEVITIKPNDWKKLFELEVLWESEVIQTLFPSGAVFRLLVDYFKSLPPTKNKRKFSYVELAQSLETLLEKYYSI